MIFIKGATAYEWQIGKFYGGFCFLIGGQWKWHTFFKRFYFRIDQNYKNKRRVKNKMNKSFKCLRTAIGFLAMGLGVALVFGNMLNGNIEILDSLSAYYWSSANLIFIGILSICGAFLISYRGYDFTDKLLTRIAGIGMLVIVMFPALGGTSYLFGFLSPQVTSTIHGIAATITFSSLGIMSYFQFPKSDSDIIFSAAKLARNHIYRICGLIIFGALICGGISKLPGCASWVTTYKVFLICEEVITLAFATSWLTKAQIIFKDVD